MVHRYTGTLLKVRKSEKGSRTTTFCTGGEKSQDDIPGPVVSNQPGHGNVQRVSNPADCPLKHRQEDLAHPFARFSQLDHEPGRDRDEMVMIPVHYHACVCTSDATSPELRKKNLSHIN